MSGRDIKKCIAALRELEESFAQHLSERLGQQAAMSPEEARAAEAAMRRVGWQQLWPVWRPYLRRAGVVSAALVVLLTIVGGALWWRLAAGPISLDMATPWLASAVEQNFGGQHRVEIGGTQLERDGNGNTAVRIRDIVVRDAEGVVVASAPKAEVGISGAGLLTGSIRAERLSLVGAEMSVRIEQDGAVTIFAGSDSRPIASAIPAGSRPAPAPATPAASGAPVPSETPAPVAPSPASFEAPAEFLGLLTRLDTFAATGLDGHNLSELGLKDGGLIVDDLRTGKRWNFADIDVSLTRSANGSVGFSIGSDEAAHRWRLNAGMVPAAGGRRTLVLDAQNVSTKDILLAMRMDGGQIDSDIPINARLHVDLAADGLPEDIKGRVTLDRGSIVDNTDKRTLFAIDRAEADLGWEPHRRTLVAPFQFIQGGNRLKLTAEVGMPTERNGPWRFGLSGGTVTLASAPPATSDAQNSLVLSRVAVNLKIDPAKRRIDIEQAEIGNLETGVVVSGHVDFATSDPRLAVGIAGHKMSLTTMMKLWPPFVSAHVRNWVADHVQAGNIDKLVVATNMPFSVMNNPKAEIPPDGLSVEVTGNGTTVTPVEGLPPIRDADFLLRAGPSSSSVAVSKGNVDLPSGRRLVLSGGMFEVPDTHFEAPPAKVRFRVDGPLQAAAELLSSPVLKDVGGAPLDPATTRGNIAGMVSLGLQLGANVPPGSVTYNMNFDFSNFSADKMLMGQKVEAALLRVNANAQGYQVKGDVKLAGLPATLEYRKPRGTGEADVRIQTTLDDAARTKMGLNVGTAIVGALPVKLNGKVPVNDQDGRFAVEADLTPVKIDNLLPGWTKPAGRAAKANFTMVKGQNTRFEDLVLDGGGVSLKGTLELDGSGDVVSANFPTFSMADGDKVQVRADRTSDGALRVTLRGDVYDGRGMLKSALAGSSDKDNKPAKDIDLDVKLGAVAGFHGETLRGLELKMSRRNGLLRSFTLNGRLGRDATINGDMRGRGGRQTMQINAGDAGALFRLTDTYPKIFGGELSMTMDPLNADQSPQDGTLNIRDFSVRGEAALDRVASGTSNSNQSNVEFSNMRVEFTRTPGRFTIRDGLVRGPVIGATIDGTLNYQSNDVHMRGTFVPLYGLNNMFGRIPIFGMFLGGSSEGLVGITYEVVGTPGAPVLRVNPISAIAPGLLRKFFEFRDTTQPAFADPNR